jgi:hypothetical protein
MKSLTLVTLLTFATLAAPAQAAIFGAQLQFSTGVNRPVAAAAAAEDDDNLCGPVKGYLDNAEKEADKVAGTQAAAKWSKLADSWWQTGVDLGCSWAA